MKLSIIIPCYNAEKYIGRCLDSLLSQNYKNIEIVAVNDGSTDKTEEIIKKYVNIDPRITYTYKRNSGVSDARNVGIENASGELITFVDCDDEVDENMYSELIKLLQDDIDIVHCSYVRNEKNFRKEVGGTGNIYTYDNIQAMITYLKGNVFNGSACNKIYRAKLIKDIKFPSTIKINEDLLFNFHAFAKAKKSVYMDKCFYIYNVEPSTSSCINTEQIKKSRDSFYVSKVLYDNSIGTGYEKYARRRYNYNKIFLYRLLKTVDKKRYCDECKKLRDDILTEYRNGNLDSTLKKQAIIIKNLNCFYIPIFKIYDKIRKPNWDV